VDDKILIIQRPHSPWSPWGSQRGSRRWNLRAACQSLELAAECAATS